MFKRFKVISLTYPIPKNIKISKWVIAEDEIPEKNRGIYRIAHLKGNKFVEDWAYFCDDECRDILRSYNAAHGTIIHPSHWWSINLVPEPIYEVLAWGKPSDDDAAESVSLEDFLKSDELRNKALKWKVKVDQEDRVLAQRNSCL